MTTLRLELRDYREILASWKKEFKEQGNKALWHECCKAERAIKKTRSYEDKLMLVHQALDVILK